MKVLNKIWFIYKNMRIRKQLLLFYIVFSIIPLILFGTFSYLISSRLIHNIVQSYAFETINQLSGNIDEMLNQIETMSLSIAYNGTIQTALNDIPQNGKLSRSDLFSIEQNMIAMYDYAAMHDITIMTSSGYTFRVPYAINDKQTDEYQFMDPSVPIAGCIWLNNTQHETIQMLRTIDSTKSYQSIGVLRVSIFSSSIDKLINSISFSEDGSITLLDPALKPITSSNSDLNDIDEISDELSGDSGIFTRKINGKTTLFFFCTSAKTGWKTVGNISISSLFRTVNNLGLIILISVVILSFFAIIFSEKMTRLFSRRINRVISHMKLAADGDFSTRLPADYNNEFGELGTGFNSMVNKINILIDTAYKAKLLQQNSELKALQAQINPHFLYNTLDTICWQAKIHHCEEINNTVMALANLMRISVDNSSSWITISQEIKYIEDYLYIQNVRYQGKVNVRINIDDQIRDVLIPKLIIQPVVENAFVHGLEMKKGKGNLNISCRQEHDQIIIEVQDDGVGMTPEQTAQIFLDNADKPGQSLGLVNVHRRIQLIYGDPYSVEIKSQPDSGTLVRIIILAKLPE